MDKGPDSWENRFPLITDVIQDSKCDIIGLQEALQFQIDQIGSEFPYYGVVGHGRRDGISRGEQAAILYNNERFAVHSSGAFWFSDTPDIPGSFDPPFTKPRICTWVRLVPLAEGTPLYVYNVHLAPLSFRLRKNIELLAERIHEREFDDPVVVTGDFNAGESHKAMKMLTSSALTGSNNHQEKSVQPALFDTFQNNFKGDSLCGTYHAFKGWRFLPRLDYILANPHFSVSESKIIRYSRFSRYPSDHFPVISILTMENANIDYAGAAKR
ncbi:MAG: hypothetical protein GF401_03830 [Chitinivibrionales bacterium]|nr:hypothetical protein [Chitinivibrionales bacterium]